MHRLDLPPEIAAQLEKAAAQAGADPERFATLLLNLAAVLCDASVQTRFARAVREHLEQQAVGPGDLAAVLSRLVAGCLRQDEGDLAAWNEEQSNSTYTIKPGFGVLMAKETPMHTYGMPAPAPVVRARASAMGRYAHLRSGSEEFARAKAAEIAREDRVRL